MTPKPTCQNCTKEGCKYGISGKCTRNSLYTQFEHMENHCHGDCEPEEKVEEGSPKKHTKHLDEFRDRGFKRENNPYVLNPPTFEEWEEEFDEKFSEYDCNLYRALEQDGYSTDEDIREEIKAYITKALAKARKEGAIGLVTHETMMSQIDCAVVGESKRLAEGLTEMFREHPNFDKVTQAEIGFAIAGYIAGGKSLTSKE